MSSFPIENEADVDKRPAEIGLPIMAEYIAIISGIRGKAAVPAARQSK
jgi:hypothetical protein